MTSPKNKPSVVFVHGASTKNTSRISYAVGRSFPCEPSNGHSQSCALKAFANVDPNIDSAVLLILETAQSLGRQSNPERTVGMTRGKVSAPIRQGRLGPLAPPNRAHFFFRS
jgi:hypothetical protein